MYALRIFGAITSFIILGLTLAYLMMNYYNDKNSKFIEIDANVTSTKIITQRRKKGGVRIGQIQINNTVTEYQPVICYTYKVDDQNYNGCFNHNSGYQSKSSADLVIKDYPNDKEIKIYYNSNDKGQSQPTKEIKFPYIPVVLLSVFMIVVPLAFIFGQSSNVERYNQPTLTFNI